MPPSTITSVRDHPTEIAAPQAPLSLEERLVLVNTAMTMRLDQAAVAYEVNTAHIGTVPVDLADVITVPDALPHTTPALPPTLYRTPVAALRAATDHDLEAPLHVTRA